MKKILLSVFIWMNIITLFAQNQADTTYTKLSDKDAQKVMNEIINKNEIKSSFLNKAVKQACTCLDSIPISGKSQKEISAKITDCIDREVNAFQMADMLMKTLSNSSKGDKVINIDLNKNNEQYVRYYRKIEEQLMDSCAKLKDMVKAENKETKYSISKNTDAQAEYNMGEKLSTRKKFNEAIPYYEKAVQIDPSFVFAWDNLAYCYRNTDQIEKAIGAYKKSLAINPYGEMPLQNLAVAYEFNKQYKEAIDAYRDYLEKYPDAVEAYYGLGRIYYIYEKDNEAGLDYFCKAYNLYVKMDSPYRVDAQKMINYIYSDMKKNKSEKKFKDILKKNNIEMSKKE